MVQTQASTMVKANKDMFPALITSDTEMDGVLEGEGDEVMWYRDGMACLLVAWMRGLARDLKADRRRSKGAPFELPGSGTIDSEVSAERWQEGQEEKQKEKAEASATLDE